MENTNMINSNLAREIAFSQEEMDELNQARSMPIVFENDCPETTPLRALKFKRVNPDTIVTGN